VRRESAAKRFALVAGFGSSRLARNKIQTREEDAKELGLGRATIFRVFDADWSGGYDRHCNGGEHTDCVGMNNFRTRAVIAIGLLRRAFRSFCFETPTNTAILEQNNMDVVIQKMREQFDVDIALRRTRHQCGDAVTLCRWNAMAEMIAIAAGTNSTVEYKRAQARYRARPEL
jgi:hypothetical protein